MAATPEAKVKAQIRRWLDARGIWYCMPIGTGLGRSGVPDFVCCWNGRFLAIEAKAPGKETNTTTHQKRELAAVQAAGGIAVVASNTNVLDDIEALYGREKF